jgi:Tfp pilus assembly protein PilO
MTEKNKQILVIGLVFAGVLAFLVGYLYFINIAPAIKANAERRTKLEAQITKHDAEISRIERFLADEEERERMMVLVENAKRRLPSTPESLEFLSLLQGALRTTGVAQSRVAPERAISNEMYEELPYTVRGSARYHEFGQFVNLIECHPDRFMRIKTFTLTNNDKRPSIHPLEVGIATFMFKGGTTAPAASAAPRTAAARARR